ncbi:MAG: hypothetical protein KDC54_17435, partial [Lewinella sp.]|nr:hypothetical protein [Lewinella sp.]
MTLPLLPSPGTVPDYSAWHALLRRQGGLLVLSFFLAAVAYYGLEWAVHDPIWLARWHYGLSLLLAGAVWAQVLQIVVYRWTLFRTVLAGFIYQPVSPYQLAFMRMVLMLVLTAHLAFYVPERLAQVAALPASSRVGLPLMNWFIQLVPISPELYAWLTRLGALACLAAALGLFTRTSLLLSTLLLFYVLGVPNFFGKVNHTHFMLWLPAFLLFAPAGEVWSLDALIRRWRGRPVATAPHYRYGIAIKFVFLQLGLLYFF